MVLRFACVCVTFSVVFANKDVFDPMSLHDQVHRGTFNGVKMLISRGVDLNKRDAHGMTPLHFAAAKGKLWTVKLLVQNGALVSLKDERGMTPLHYAAKSGRALTVRWLLNNTDALEGVNEQDLCGMTPLHYAAISESHETVRYLIEIGNAKKDLRDNTGRIPIDYVQERNNVLNKQKYVYLRSLLSDSAICFARVVSPQVDERNAEKPSVSTVNANVYLKNFENRTVRAVVSKICLKGPEKASEDLLVSKVYLRSGIPTANVVDSGTNLENSEGYDVGSESSNASIKTYEEFRGSSPEPLSIYDLDDEIFDDPSYPYGWQYYAMYYPNLLKPQHYDLLFS